VRNRGWTVLVLPLLAACSGTSDVDTDTDVFDAPDITGRYDVQVTGTNGCIDDSGESNASLILDWAPGPMVVSGTPDSLVFDFLDEVVMNGSVDRTFQVNFGGTVTVDAFTVSAFGAGAAAEEGAQWTISGKITGTADDDGVESNDCTIEAPYSATRLGS
jgi:hypothetical protein